MMQTIVRDGYDVDLVFSSRQHSLDAVSWLNSTERCGTYKIIPSQTYLLHATGLVFPVTARIKFFNVTDALMFKLTWIGKP